MAPPQRCRVLRCCSCGLFQAHQLKKSPKWTCKACGKKQSFLRSYGEGSGADCRRHVQKLNLLQGQISELPLRSLEGSGSVSEEEIEDHHQAENVHPQPSESRWLKFLHKDSPELELGGGVCFRGQSSSDMEESDPAFSQELPRKRKWSPSPAQLSHNCDIPDLATPRGTWPPQQDSPGLNVKVKAGGSHRLWNHEDPRPLGLRVAHGELPRPACQAEATSSKWARFLPSPVNSSQVDTEQRGLRPAGPAQAEQGTPWAPTPRESWEAATVQLPQVTQPPRPGSEGPCSRIPEQRRGTEPPQVPGTQKPAALRLSDLFTTGEDFSDDL